MGCRPSLEYARRQTETELASSHVLWASVEGSIVYQPSLTDTRASNATSSSHVSCNLLSASCQPVSQDPTGAVSSGELRLAGILDQATLLYSAAESDQQDALVEIASIEDEAKRAVG